MNTQPKWNPFPRGECAQVSIQYRLAMITMLVLGASLATAIGSTTLTNLFAVVVEKPTPATQPAEPTTQPMAALAIAANAKPIADVLPTIIDRPSSLSDDLITNGMAGQYLGAGDTLPLNSRQFRNGGARVAVLGASSGTPISKSAANNEAFRQAVNALDVARPLPMTFAGSPNIADAALNAFHDQVAASYAYVPGRVVSDTVAPLGMDEDASSDSKPTKTPTSPISHTPRVRTTRQTGGLAYETGVASRPLGDNGVRPHPGAVSGVDPWDGGGRNTMHGDIPGAGEVGNLGDVGDVGRDVGSVSRGVIDPGAGGVVVTPEPTTIAVVLAATVGVMTRRRTK